MFLYLILAFSDLSIVYTVFLYFLDKLRQGQIHIFYIYFGADPQNLTHRLENNHTRYTCF